VKPKGLQSIAGGKARACCGLRRRLTVPINRPTLKASQSLSAKDIAGRRSKPALFQMCEKFLGPFRADSFWMDGRPAASPA
jgi:hypothetical protein